MAFLIRFISAFIVIICCLCYNKSKILLINSRDASMKEKLMKLFCIMKKNAVPLIKKAASFLIIFVGLLSLVAFVSIPFMHNIITRKLGMNIWCLAFIIFAIFYIINIIKSKSQEGKYPVFNFLANIGIVPIMTLFCSAFVINYHETKYNWWWTIFVFVLVFFPVFILCGRQFIKKQKMGRSNLSG